MERKQNEFALARIEQPRPAANLVDTLLAPFDWLSDEINILLVRYATQVDRKNAKILVRHGPRINLKPIGTDDNNEDASDDALTIDHDNDDLDLDFDNETMEIL